MRQTNVREIEFRFKMNAVKKKCKSCTTEILEDEEYYQCDICKEVMHKACSNLSASEVRCLNLQKRTLRLMCNSCLKFMEKLPTFMNMMEEMSNELNKIKEIVLKTDKEISENRIVMETNEVVKGRTENTIKSYSEVVQAKKEVLIVKPKQKTLHTEVKRDLITNVDPIALNVDVKMGRNLRDGGVILECDNNASINTVKERIEKDMGNKYSVSLPKKINPRMKIVNVPSEISKDVEELKRKIINQNKIDSNDRSNFTLDIIHISNEFKNRYNILIEVDMETFNMLMKMEVVNISLYKCKIYEFLRIMKCYKCCGFNHGANNCNESLSCPKCSGPHEAKNCKSNQVRCINCIRANKKFNLNLDIDHTVWDRECPCLIKVEKAQKNKTNYQANLI